VIIDCLCENNIVLQTIYNILPFSWLVPIPSPDAQVAAIPKNPCFEGSAQKSWT